MFPRGRGQQDPANNSLLNDDGNKVFAGWQTIPVDINRPKPQPLSYGKSAPQPPKYPPPAAPPAMKQAQSMDFMRSNAAFPNGQQQQASNGWAAFDSTTNPFEDPFDQKPNVRKQRQNNAPFASPQQARIAAKPQPAQNMNPFLAGAAPMAPAQAGTSFDPLTMFSTPGGSAPGGGYGSRPMVQPGTAQPGMPPLNQMGSFSPPQPGAQPMSAQPQPGSQAQNQWFQQKPPAPAQQISAQGSLYDVAGSPNNANNVGEDDFWAGLGFDDLAVSSQPALKEVEGQVEGKKKTKKKRKKKTKTVKAPVSSSSSEEFPDSDSSSYSAAKPEPVVSKKKSRGRAKVKHKTEALAELMRGTAMLKFPSKSGYFKKLLPHFKYVQLRRKNGKFYVLWFSKKKNLKDTSIALEDITEIRKGQESDVFKRYQAKDLRQASFSIMYRDGCSLDLVAKSVQEAEMWTFSLKKLVSKLRQGKEMMKIKEIEAPVKFEDRSRPKSAPNCGKFERANTENKKTMMTEEERMNFEKEYTKVQKTMENHQTKFQKVKENSKNWNVSASDENDNISRAVNWMDERLQEMKIEFADIKSIKIARRDAWRFGVDLDVLEEKINVVIKHKGVL